MYELSAGIYDALYSFKDYAAESEMLHALIQEHAPGARTLLDVACGTGKHLEHLRAHYAVEGLDREPQFLAIARGRLPGVPLHEGDMVDFDLGRRFDAVTCLFSAIGYALTRDRLRAAVAAMARHLAPGGVLVVEPWLTPEAYRLPHVGGLYVDEPELKIARIDAPERIGDLSAMDMHYLVGTPAGVEHFVERHELGLFTQDAYMGAVASAGLEARHDPDGLIGRGLYLGLARG